MQDDTFGRLLKAALSSIVSHEGKTAPVIEADLGRQMGVAGATVQRYKAGHIPPDPDQVRILAEAAVTRGYLNRQWLESFLQVARYPDPARLIAQLYPPEAPRPAVPRIYENLPAATYSRFIMRDPAYAAVLEGLGRRLPVVLIASLGGMGKTSLAREVAARCLAADAEPHFDAVVWISDKDRPGTTNLSLLLDEIARTLDYPGIIDYAEDDKRREVEQLLRRRRMLLVVDNYETITDGALAAWLTHLPETSKALVTSREYAQAFTARATVVHLGALSDFEARALITQRLRRLGMDDLVPDPGLLAPLVGATGGNPLAIEMALGCIKYGQQPLPDVLDDLAAARGVTDLFDNLFQRSWALLGEPARRVFQVLPLFVGSASRAALAAVADLPAPVCERALERLTGLALIDSQRTDLLTPPRYSLHPLARAFARNRLLEQPAFAAAAHRRRLAWYLDLAAQVGYCWEDLGRLARLDPEQETLHAVVRWALEEGHYAETVQLARDAGYYFYVRGLWSKEPPNDLMQAQAARLLGDAVAEVEALSRYVQVLSRQHKLADADTYFPRLHDLAARTALPNKTLMDYRHGVASSWLARGQIDRAQQIWEESLPQAEDPYQRAAMRNWIGVCLYRKGCLQEAQAMFRASLREAEAHNIQQIVGSNQTKLIEIALDLGRLDEAAAALAESSAHAQRDQNQAQLAELHFAYARLHAQRGDPAAARAALAEAIDRFARLGRRRDFVRAQEELARLDAAAASEEAPAAPTVYSGRSGFPGASIADRYPDRGGESRLVRGERSDSSPRPD
jgi:tetratricopeptide (TPR) repeat protein